MCGIAGIFHYGVTSRPVDLAVLEAMTRSLAHRGPDGHGTWAVPGIGLGHRRLAIIDPSDSGRQPMADGSGHLWITFNGEIYNFRELRDELAALGFCARTRTDTEVILLGYRAWGVEVVRRLSGIFAFALWDVDRRQLFLARDHFGIKPLFFSDIGGTLRFASEIKSILTDPQVDRAVDSAAIDAFLTFSYTPAPATGFARVRQLQPAECALVDHQGLRRWTYWTIPYTEQPSEIRFDAAVEEFRGLLDRVVKAQTVSDVAVGAFLSGGLDSTAVVRAMTRAGGAVTTLNVGFPFPGFDEREPARRIARSLGVEFESELVDVDAVALLPELSLHMEEPTADSSMLPVYLLCQAARRRFTVALSGDGADETLAGYDTYRATSLARYYRMLPGIVRRNVLAPMSRRLPVNDRKYSLHQLATRFTSGAEQGPGRDHASWRVMLDAPLKRRLYTRGFAQEVANCDAIGLYAGWISAVPRHREALAGLLHADTCFYLPNDMLVKVDRMSMAHGLEVRVPFLDIALVTFCANLPGEYKLRRGLRKHLLRESLRGVIADDILEAPKSGFNVPLEAWMRGPLGDLLLDTVSTCRDDLGDVLRAAEVEVLLRDHRNRRANHAHPLFTVLMLGLWFHNRAKAWRL